MSKSHLTYRELAEAINTFTEEQKDSSVTVYIKDHDEFYPLYTDTLKFGEHDDVLDKDHPFLEL